MPIKFIFSFQKSEIDANLFTITQVKQQSRQSFAFNKTETAIYLHILLRTQNGQTLYIAYCTAPRRAGWFGFGLSLSRQIWISITVMRYQKKNNCKSPNFTALKTMIYIFYKKTHYHKKNNNKVFKFLPQKSHNKYQKSRLTFEKSCEKTVMKKKQSLDVKKNRSCQ